MTSKDDVTMRSVAAGTRSGCLVGVVVFGLLLTCLCPTALFIGSFSSTLQADLVARLVGRYLCPQHSEPEVVTYQTTSPSEFGEEVPATAYEMQCVDESGAVVREPSPDYAFYWIALLAVGSLALSGLLALPLAVPAGALITRWVQRSRKTGA
jgi:hypothetical protein